jgi:hypothetical protein
MHETAARGRVEAALAGAVELSELSIQERTVFNAEIDVAIQEHAGRTSYGDVLAREGVTTVALDDQGRLVQFHPDGSSTVLE